ncbi:MAG: RNA polymerase sigma factor [Acidobacteria bacterium]|jgi:RNA polymerase sigma-70 factor (ECF subfamily)|nr:RNA polymerase sigma factor [Acidobacteriota bacterium]
MSQSLEAAVESLVSRADEADLDVEFEERLKDSGAIAFRVAYGVLRHREDAEDVAQEALARAYQGFRQMRDRGRFRSWLVRICWRLALDHQRAATRRVRREQESPVTSGPSDLEPAPCDNEFRARLWEAVAALPEKLRLVVVLAGIQGHDLKEVGELLGVPHGTVRSRMHAARKRLAEALR